MAVAVFPLGPLQTNSYIIHNATRAVAVDVGGDPAPMLEYLKSHQLTLDAVCITHRHFDHMYGVAELADATGAPVYMPQGDDSLADTESGKGGIWGFPPVPDFKSSPMPLGKTSIGGMDCEVLETPGHTPGGVSLYFPEEQVVFTGDALFYRSIGRTDFPGGDHDTLLRSVRDVLFKLPAETVAYPGHGPATKIGDEAANNPFCGEFRP
ncbi:MULTISPECIES: MBL fold metallo-hydrolase [Desulfovibrio]|uniref:Glyoxylase, beta-lactamase superfamily II n=1 Tax=Desulfovibrio desulfuricans TaxID=876 RepID=A0AA94HTX1_DESDE|nr:MULTISPECIES: MBL fold metallo-hydrolase [Desulfovibrio]ATD80644.1 MBL fold metallo-hydrolase [Desulfovibrio sp. G11]SFW60592.1 Glyoxylase, beta-lactamase superfamily II [Desulfovibrio desulfuricans]SPD36155.1 Metallo-beta-lactamase superfamily [Desulfovibrio sp. G11]